MKINKFFCLSFLLTALWHAAAWSSVDTNSSINVDNPHKIPGTNLDKKSFVLTIIKRLAPSRSLDQLLQETLDMNKYIGSYPPHLTSEKEREMVYKKWLDLVSDAEATPLSATTEEKVLYVSAELYRQGHNLDVVGSAEKAMSKLNTCLIAYPKSVACNMSAAYLYLFIGPQYLNTAEKSLQILRKHFAPKLNADVEGLYVFVYLFQRNETMVKKQIDEFIKHFPNHEDVKVFSEMRKAKLVPEKLTK